MTKIKKVCFYEKLSYNFLLKTAHLKNSSLAQIFLKTMCIL